MLVLYQILLSCYARWGPWDHTPPYHPPSYPPPFPSAPANRHPLRAVSLETSVFPTSESLGVGGGYEHFRENHIPTVRGVGWLFWPGVEILAPDSRFTIPPPWMKGCFLTLEPIAHSLTLQLPRSLSLVRKCTCPLNTLFELNYHVCVNIWHVLWLCPKVLL